jgi:hypothetical protein
MEDRLREDEGWWEGKMKGERWLMEGQMKKGGKMEWKMVGGKDEGGNIKNGGQIEGRTYKWWWEGKMKEGGHLKEGQMKEE